MGVSAVPSDTEKKPPQRLPQIGPQIRPRALLHCDADKLQFARIITQVDGSGAGVTTLSDTSSKYCAKVPRAGANRRVDWSESVCSPAAARFVLKSSVLNDVNGPFLGSTPKLWLTNTTPSSKTLSKLKSAAPPTRVNPAISAEKVASPAAVANVWQYVVQASDFVNHH